MMGAGQAGSAIGMAGTILQMIANGQDQDAINKAKRNEVAQQGIYQGEANAITRQNIASSGAKDAQAQMAAGQNNRGQIYNNLSQALAPVGQANPTGGAGGARAGAAGGAWNNLVAGNVAKAGSYSDWEANQANKNAQASQKLGILGSFSKGTASLLPTQLQVAAHKADTLSGWGEVIQDIGNTIGGSPTSAAVGKPDTGGGWGGPVSDAYEQQGTDEMNSIAAGGNIGGQSVWQGLY